MNNLLAVGQQVLVLRTWYDHAHGSRERKTWDPAVIEDVFWVVNGHKVENDRDIERAAAASPGSFENETGWPYYGWLYRIKGCEWWGYCKPNEVRAVNGPAGPGTQLPLMGGEKR